MRARLSPVRGLTRDEINHLLDTARGSTPHFRRLARHLRAQRGDWADDLRAFDVLFGEIELQHALQRPLWWSSGGDTRQGCDAVGPGTIGCFGEHRFTGVEVSIEAAMREAGVLHDAGNARTPIAAPANSAGGSLDDAIVSGFL